jgi:hypothetical protein
MGLVVSFTEELIHVSAPQTEVMVQDLINAIRAAEGTPEGMAYGQIARASGKAPLGPGVAVGLTVELLGEWQLEFWAGEYVARVAGGNLVGGPGGDPIAFTPGVQVVLVQSASATVVDTGRPTPAQVAEAVWAAGVAEHTQPGSFGEQLSQIADVELGRWQLRGNQLVFYKPDNTTELCRFDLFDRNGRPSMTEVFERRRA